MIFNSINGLHRIAYDALQEKYFFCYKHIIDNDDDDCRVDKLNIDELFCDTYVLLCYG